MNPIVTKYAEALDTAKTLAAGLAQRIGFGEPVTLDQRQGLIETLMSVVTTFGAVADELAALVQKSTVIAGTDAKSLTEALADIQKRREQADKVAAKARNDAADRTMRGA